MESPAPSVRSRAESYWMNMAQVKVSNLSSETAPKSLKVYNPTSSIPAPRLGLSNGTVTRKNVATGPRPRPRADSSRAGSIALEGGSHRQEHIRIAQQGQHQECTGEPIDAGQPLDAEGTFQSALGASPGVQGQPPR